MFIFDRMHKNVHSQRLLLEELWIYEKYKIVNEGLFLSVWWDFVEGSFRTQALPKLDPPTQPKLDPLQPSRSKSRSRIKEEGVEPKPLHNQVKK